MELGLDPALDLEAMKRSAKDVWKLEGTVSEDPFRGLRVDDPELKPEEPEQEEDGLNPLVFDPTAEMRNGPRFRGR